MCYALSTSTDAAPVQHEDISITRLAVLVVCTLAYAARHPALSFLSSSIAATQPGFRVGEILTTNCMC